MRPNPAPKFGGFVKTNTCVFEFFGCDDCVWLELGEGFCAEQFTSIARGDVRFGAGLSWPVVGVLRKNSAWVAGFCGAALQGSLHGRRHGLVEDESKADEQT